MTKYSSESTTIDNVRFASRKEGRRYEELKILLRANLIRALTLQPRFSIDINGKFICWYVADFHYFDVASETWIIEDCKGFRTPLYKLKKKLYEALYDQKILET